MSGPNKESCETCYFCELLDGDFEGLMGCFRYPPSVDVDLVLRVPQVMTGDWCGEFKPMSESK